MRGIDCRDYTLTVPTPQGEQSQPYAVAESIAFVLLSPQLQLNGPELLKAQKVAEKVMAAKEGDLLLEEAEWERAVKALQTVTGLGRNDVEMVRRVLEAPEVPVGPRSVPSS